MMLDMEPSPSPGPRPWLILAGFATLFLLAKLAGLDAWIEVERLRAWVAATRPFGPLVFLLVFATGVLLQIPGLVFVFAAPLLFPSMIAVPLAIVGANLAVNLNFLVVRRMGGQALGPMGHGLIHRAFEQLQTHPIRSVALLRAALVMFPPLTGALALTRLRFRDHALATVLVLSPVTGIIVVLESLAL